MKNEKIHELAIIGAGISGLCTAWYAQKRFNPDDIVLLEASNKPGGTTGTDTFDGYRCDWGSNGFLDKEPKTIEWIRELGLEKELVQADAAAKKRFIYRQGRLHEVKMPPAFLASPLLSLGGRLRLCAEPLIPAKKDDAPESIHDFAARRIGKEAAEILVGPMVSGVFGGDAHALSLAHCFPRMAEMEKKYGGLVKALIAKKREHQQVSPAGPSGILTTFREGIGRLVDEAAGRLGGILQFNSPVHTLEKSNDRYLLRLPEKTIEAQRVVIACPAYAAAAMLASALPETARALDAIPYAGIAVVCTGYARAQITHPLDGFGFLAPRSQSLRLLGCLWTSSIFPHQANPDHVLLRTMIGGATDPQGVTLSDDDLTEIVQKELQPLLGISGSPAMTRIFRHPKGIPQYTIGHGERLAIIEAAENSHKGLAFAGNAYRGIGLNDCVLSAHHALARLE